MGTLRRWQAAACVVAMLTQGCVAQVASEHEAASSRSAVEDESSACRPRAPERGDKAADDEDVPEFCLDAPVKARDLLMAHCEDCHQPIEERGHGPLYGSDFASIRSPALMIREGRIVPGSSEDSPLCELFAADGHLRSGRGPELSPPELNTLHDWIECGAREWPGAVPAPAEEPAGDCADDAE